MQEQFSNTDQPTKLGSSLDGTDYNVILDTGAAKSLISNLYYFRNKSLHGLHRFSSKANVIQVGNEESVSMLFNTPFIMTVMLLASHAVTIL